MKQRQMCLLPPKPTSICCSFLCHRQHLDLIEEQVRTSSLKHAELQRPAEKWKERWLSPSLLLLCSTHSIRCSISLLNFFWDLGPKHWERRKRIVHWWHTRADKIQPVNSMRSPAVRYLLLPRRGWRLCAAPPCPSGTAGWHWPPL